MSQERTSFGVFFYIRTTRLNKHCEASINLRITVDGDRAETTVKKTIHPTIRSKQKGCRGDNLSFFIYRIDFKIYLSNKH